MSLRSVVRLQIRRLVPVASFLSGILWDELTLTRIDTLSDNVTLLVYLVVLGALIALGARVAREPDKWPRLAPRAAWLDTGKQFVFGSLYAAYIVYYLKSAQWGLSLVFVGTLGLLLAANRFAAEHTRDSHVRIALFTACVLSFALFFVPVVTGFPGPGLFVIAATIALAAAALVAGAGHATDEVAPREAVVKNAWPALAVVVCVALFDVAGLVPPVPFALLDGGIYHGVARADRGLDLTYEAPPWYLPWRTDDRWFRYREGDKVTCFTAIFAPERMDLGVVHAWERYDRDEGWVRTDAIPFHVEGGRASGYRGYTTKRNVQPGDWRVRVLTASGREIGRYGFTIDAGPWKAPARLKVRHVE